jgi:hypothetical protein
VVSTTIGVTGVTEAEITEVGADALVGSGAAVEAVDLAAAMEVIGIVPPDTEEAAPSVVYGGNVVE